LDPAFGSSGLLTFAASSGATGVAVDPSGRIYAACGGAVLAFTSAGSVDGGFHGGVPALFDASGQAQDLQLDGSGRLILAGASGSSAAVWRMLSSGSLDGGFGSGGKVSVSALIAAQFIALDQDASGGLLACGYGTNGTQSRWLALRLDGSGAAAAGFGAAGLASGATVGSLGAPQSAAGGFLNADGSLLLAGQSPSGFLPDAAWWSLGFTGALNGAYGSGGQRSWGSPPGLACRPRTAASLSRATGYLGGNAAFWGFGNACGGATAGGSPGGLGSGSAQSQAIAYPVPAKDHITFAMTLAQDADVKLEVYDERGQRLSSGSKPFSAGTVLWPFDLSGYAPGVYLYRLAPSAGPVPPLGKFVVQP
jgi:hypothetical protein